MRTDLFNYNLPPQRIAQRPLERREMARMMVFHRASGEIEHRHISSISGYLRHPDVLVLNNTKVIPSRVFGRKIFSGGKVELLLLEECHPGEWKALIKTSRPPKAGDKLTLCSGKAKAILLHKCGRGEVVLKIESDRPLMEILDEEGFPPLPPYLSRKEPNRAQKEADRTRYQTVYASEPGAVAAPTAGLHFTPEILRKIQEQGIYKAELTLHVGPGTFRTVSSETVMEHKMDRERYVVSVEAASTISCAREKGGRIFAVGSTCVRTLESRSKLIPSEGTTDLFIHPPYQFKHVDAILTNLHPPRSTPLMMICVFAGREQILAAYQKAIKEKYRFCSYGDCMLIL